jgi:hypothetical protein
VNIYLLVEGRNTERIVYSNWLVNSLENHVIADEFDNLNGRSIFCFSGEGFPSVLDRALPKAVLDIRGVGAYDALVVVFDCDDAEVEVLREHALRIIAGVGGLPPHVDLVLVIQKRCIESWLLGNRRFIPRIAQSSDLVDCKRFYDVTTNCPEEMGAPSKFSGSASAFHLHYLRAAFRERGLIYSKSRPSDAANIAYLRELRIRNREGDLRGMDSFFEFLARAA